MKNYEMKIFYYKCKNMYKKTKKKQNLLNNDLFFQIHDNKILKCYKSNQVS